MEELINKTVIRNKIYKNLKLKMEKVSKMNKIAYEILEIIKYNIEKIIIKADNLFLNEISKLLHNISFSSNTIGYELYKEAIYYILSEDKQKTKNSMTNLYIELGNRMNISSESVEKNMRYALKKAWNNQNIIRLEKILGYAFVYEHERPSNGILITTLVEYLKNNL